QGVYSANSPSGKPLFHIEGKSTEVCHRIEQLLHERERETEETSLKFSNLPVGEIRLWREGRPSAELLYRLSFWNDLAIWLLRLQEEGHYQVHFSYAPSGVPNRIHIDLPELTIAFYLPEALLPALIPTLKQIHTPLSVHDFALETVTGLGY